MRRWTAKSEIGLTWLAAVLLVVLVACDAPAARPAPTSASALAPIGSSLSDSTLSPRQTPAPDPSASARDSVAAAAEAEGVQPNPVADGATVTPAPSPTIQPSPTPAARVYTVALDPGHGGPEIGAAASNLAEKDVNLRIALKLANLLRERDIAVVLTRDSDRSVSPEYTGGGYPGVGRDLQARVDIANAADADLFISIHHNGSNDPSLSGTEVWYSSQRAFAEENLRLAKLAQSALVKRIRALGYPVVDRGIKDDSNFRTFRGNVYNIYVLGPGTGTRPHVSTAMPGILGETLFLSNAGDAAMLRQERTLDAIAAGYRDAVVEFKEGVR